MKMKNKFNKMELIVYPIFAFVMLAFDQLTKIIAHAVLPGGNNAVKVIDNFFYFTYTTNYGGAWSMFEGQTWLFILSAIVAVLLLGYLFVNTKPNDKFTRFGLTLVLSGAIGNCIDRVLFGYVRDFIDFIIFGYDFPIFNIADVCIVLGIIMIIIDTFEEEWQQWKQSRKS